ncbi:MAG: hypothetical protein HGA36_03910 [Candidatus Moranbacteria bacterium]|nr:hypothetical protein [Candidatus Moranbacteria bacterium]
MAIAGLFGLAFDREIDSFFQMMEHSAILLSVMALLIGIMSMALAPIKPKMLPKTTAAKTEPADSTSKPDAINTAEKSNQKKNPWSKKQKPKKPSEIEGLIVDK